MSRFMAAIYDWGMREVESACLSQWRRELLAQAEGDVLEIGAGTGANLPYYPSELSQLVLSEPDPHMRDKLVRRTGGRAELRSDEAGALGFDDESFSVVVATLVLCSVPDVQAALSEIHRVLRPGGRFIFIEHVAAERGSSRHRWQRRLEPVWKRCMGNCHLTRDTAEAIERAGLRIDELTRQSMRKAMPLVRPSIRGTAVKALAGDGAPDR